MIYEWEFRTGKWIANDEKCLDCESKPCIDACKKYGRDILKIVDGKVRLKDPEEDMAKRCIEDLGCEYECHFRGNGAIHIDLPIKGLEEYRESAKKRLGGD